MSGTTPDDTPNVGTSNLYRPEGDAKTELETLFGEVKLRRAVVDKADREWFETNTAFWERARVLGAISENYGRLIAKTDDKGLYFVNEEDLQTMLQRLQALKKAAVGVQQYQAASEFRALEKMLSDVIAWQMGHLNNHQEILKRLSERLSERLDESQAKIDDLRRRFDPTYDKEDHSNEPTG